MNEKQAKRILRRLRRHYTLGSILHLLSDLHRLEAEQAKFAGNELAFDQHKVIGHTLLVVGLGVDAILPR